jgi:hypothetical protein
MRLTQNEHSAVGKSGNQKLWYCSFGKMENPGTNFDFAFFFKSYGRSYGEFSEPGFPHKFAKNGRQDLKMGCTDASRRQLRSVPKNWGLN